MKRRIEIEPSPCAGERQSAARRFRPRRSTTLSFWDGGIIDNTPLGDAIAGIFRIWRCRSHSRRDEFVPERKRAPPTNMIEVNDRAEPSCAMAIGSARIGRTRIPSTSCCRRSSALAAADARGSLDHALEERVHDAARFKMLDAITDIDLADPDADGESRLAAVVATSPRSLSRFLRRQASSGVMMSDIGLPN